MTFYSTKLWWKTGNTIESEKVSEKEAREDFRRLKKMEAVKKVVLRKHFVFTTTVKSFKRSGS
jgi:hypothetical protein